MRLECAHTAVKSVIVCITAARFAARKSVSIVIKLTAMLRQIVRLRVIAVRQAGVIFRVKGDVNFQNKDVNSNFCRFILAFVKFLIFLNL